MINTISEFLNNVTLGSLSLGNLVLAIILLFLCRIIAKIILNITEKAMKKTKLDIGMQRFISSVVKVLTWILTITIVADYLGIAMTSLIALLSIAGLALSLSIQNQLSNLFSGLTILFVKPFVIGDFIAIDDIAGIVREVGLFVTTISTTDNRIIHIPNSDTASSKITNYSREPLRRVDMKFETSYDSPIEDVKAALLDAARDSRILSEPAPPFTAVSAYKESSIEYILRVWCHNSDYWGVFFTINEKVPECFEAHGVEMSYNHLNIHTINE